MKRSLLVFALISIFFTGSVFAQELSKQEKEVWDVVKKEWKAWAGKDVDGLVGVIHEQYLGWSNDRPIPADKWDVKKSYQEMAEKGEVIDFDLQLARISVTDNAAVVHYYFAFAGKMGGEGIGAKGKYTEFFVKDGGKWMLLGDFTFMEEKK